MFKHRKIFCKKYVDIIKTMFIIEYRQGQKSKPILYKPILILPHLKLPHYNKEERQVKNMKRYYRVVTFLGTTTKDEVWHCTHSTVLSLHCDMIIPLDRKPRNVEIYEG